MAVSIFAISLYNFRELKFVNEGDPYISNKGFGSPLPGFREILKVKNLEQKIVNTRLQDRAYLLTNSVIIY